MVPPSVVVKDGMGGRRLARSFSRSTATERLVNAIFVVIIPERFQLTDARRHSLVGEAHRSSRLKDGCRTIPSSVISAYAISASNLGSTQAADSGHGSKEMHAVYASPGVIDAYRKTGHFNNAAAVADVERHGAIGVTRDAISRLTHARVVLCLPDPGAAKDKCLAFRCRRHGGSEDLRGACRVASSALCADHNIGNRRISATSVIRRMPSSEHSFDNIRRQ
jgi:hypothetical protein